MIFNCYLGDITLLAHILKFSHIHTVKKVTQITVFNNWYIFAKLKP